MAQEIKPALTTVRVETTGLQIRPGRLVLAPTAGGSPSSRCPHPVCRLPFGRLRDRAAGRRLRGALLRWLPAPDPGAALRRRDHRGGPLHTRGESLARLAGGRLRPLTVIFLVPAVVFPVPSSTSFAMPMVSSRCGSGGTSAGTPTTGRRSRSTGCCSTTGGPGAARRPGAGRRVGPLGAAPGRRACSGRLAVADGEGARIYGPSPDQVLASLRGLLSSP